MIKKIKILSISIGFMFCLGFGFGGVALAATGCTSGNASACLQGSKIMTDVVKPAINILSGLVLIAATIMIIVAGIMYSSSGGDPAKVTKAKTMITNVIIGIVAYIFLWAFIQWLIPGGVKI